MPFPVLRIQIRVDLHYFAPSDFKNDRIRKKNRIQIKKPINWPICYLNVVVIECTSFVVKMYILPKNNCMIYISYNSTFYFKKSHKLYIIFYAAGCPFEAESNKAKRILIRFYPFSLKRKLLGVCTLNSCMPPASARFKI